MRLMLFVVTPSMGSNRKLNVLQHLNIVAVLPLCDMCQCVHIENIFVFLDSICVWQHCG